MSTLNLGYVEPEAPKKSKIPLILRTILATIITIAVVGSAVANGYFYFKWQETDEKLAQLQKDVKNIKHDIVEAPDLSKLEDGIEEVQDKLVEMDNDLTAIKSDVNSIQDDVGNIESDVSSIQLKIGY